MAPDDDPIDTAWKIHAAIVDWTGKVDSKASFALAIESAVLAGVISMTGGHRRLANLGGWAEVLFWFGMTFMLASLLCAIYVVRPRLRSKKVSAESASNFIFFGHLKDWEAGKLEEALCQQDVLPVLSRQLVNMSKIAWVKHRLLQLSLTGAVIAGGLIGVAALLNN
jgi:hypothetical protein